MANFPMHAERKGDCGRMGFPVSGVSDPAGPHASEPDTRSVDVEDSVPDGLAIDRPLDSGLESVHGIRCADAEQLQHGLTLLVAT
jgi:hypothetical protein